MSGTLPTTPGMASAQWRSQWPGLQTQTDIGATQRVNYLGHFFEVDVEYPLMKRETAKPLIGFLQAQQGAFDNFAAGITGYTNVDGAVYDRHLAVGPSGTNDITTELNVASSYAVGTTSINYTSNFTSTYYNNSTHGDFFIVGDIVKFSNHNKLYMIVEQTNPNSSGAGSVKVLPTLTTAIDATTDIYYYNVYGNWFLKNTDIMWGAGLSDTVELAFTLREDV